MSWYNTNGKENDVVISSRVRFARNIADYPFASKLDETSAKEIIEKVSGVFSGSQYKLIDFAKLSPVEIRSYVEKHYASPEFANGTIPRALIIDEHNDDIISVMVCEEDHIRIQCITAGLSLDKAFDSACEADDMLCDKLNIAYDEQLGFLTHCPTNLGTGMRASVMLFLPALTMTERIGQLSAQLSKIGLTIRGLYGEGSEADGCLYQISNQITLGLTETDTIKKLNEVIAQITKSERTLRSSIKSDSADRLTDRVCRSYGTLTNAYMLTSKEFMKLYSDVRLGIALGLLDKTDYETLGGLMINVLPATLSLNSGKDYTDTERDKARALYCRKILEKVKE